MSFIFTWRPAIAQAVSLLYLNGCSSNTEGSKELGLEGKEQHSRVV